MDFSVLISKSLLIYEPNQLAGLPYIQSMGRDILENQLAFENEGTNLKASHHGMHGQPETAMM